MKLRIKTANSYGALDKAYEAIKTVHNEAIVATQYLQEAGEVEMAENFGMLSDRMLEIRSEFEDKYFIRTNSRQSMKLKIEARLKKAKQGISSEKCDCGGSYEIEDPKNTTDDNFVGPDAKYKVTCNGCGKQKEMSYDKMR